MKDNDKTLPTWSVAVFAHNEQAIIGACLESIFAEKNQAELSVYVLANGCTDGTVQKVRNFAGRWPAIHLVEIEVGDKANAWNVFVHEIAPVSEGYFFMDGDVRLDPGALLKLSAALQSSPEAFIASAVPGSGRHRAYYIKSTIEEHGVHGNLYCIAPAFIAQLRARNVKLPIGFVREDGLVGALAKFSLAPQAQPWNNSRVKVCVESRFLFHSMRSWHPSDWKKYYRRRLRYSIGHFENRMLRVVLGQSGVECMPASVKELYRVSDPPQLEWRGLNTLFDWLALRRIKKIKNGAS